MEIHLYNKNNIDQLDWGQSKDNLFAKNYLYPMVKDGCNKYIDNVDAEMNILVVDDVIFPIVFGNPNQKIKNSYVCSPTSHYIDYGKSEVQLELRNQPFLKNILFFLIDALGKVFKTLDFEKVVYVNNWLLSTNLYTEFDNKVFLVIKDFLMKKFPDYTIIFRSINDMYDINMHQSLKGLGFGEVLSRQVYILDPKKEIYKKKESYQKDLKLKRKSKYYWENVENFEYQDYNRLRFLYDDLYIKKYSELNPTFNENFLKYTNETKCFTYRILKKDDKIYGVFGYFERDGFITAPVFGYDTSMPEKDGLYRLTALRILEDAIEKSWIVHQSSGVSKFKMHRGAESSIEYNMVYYDHVRFKQKIPWFLLEKLTSSVIIPIMKKYQL